jgi:hypothetical protein
LKRDEQVCEQNTNGDLARVLVLAVIAMAASAVLAQLHDFNAHAIVDEQINHTIVGGRFSPRVSVDLTSQVVILSVEGAKSFRLSVPAGSFRTTGLGGYVASVIEGLVKTDILLMPFSGGDWAYSAGIKGFIPASTSVTVSLTIGSQAERATADVYGF